MTRFFSSFSIGLVAAAVTFLASAGVAAAQGASQSAQVGRYTLTASHTTNGIYRLDTTTGAIQWCRPTGDEKSGYRLVCVAEVK